LNTAGPESTNSAARRAIACLRERRIPWKWTRFLSRLEETSYLAKCLSRHYLPNRADQPVFRKPLPELRCLLTMAVDGEGKHFLRSILESLDVPGMDVLVFCYDDTSFTEPVFRDATVLHRRGMKWQLLKSNLHPEEVRDYDYIFAWDDDIALEQFSFSRFLEVLQRNRLEVAQPGLGAGSFVNMPFTEARRRGTGRFTDCVENMVPVFTRSAWARWWHMMEDDLTHWGWQYTVYARAACGYRRMGVVDCERVVHTRPNRSARRGAPAEAREYTRRHPDMSRARRICYATMR